MDLRINIHLATLGAVSYLSKSLAFHRNRKESIRTAGAIVEMEGKDETRRIYELIIARTVERMRPEFDHEGLPTSILEQVKESWTKQMDKSMQPLSTDLYLFRNMTGLANPAPSYKQPYWSRETTPKVTVVEPVQPPKPVAVVTPQPAPEDLEDSVAAMFEQLKRKQEEHKEADTPPEPEEDDLAHVSDDETNQENPVESDTMCGLWSKIKRSKTRWKFTLSNCILNITGRDLLLRQINGNTEFQ